MVNKKLIIAGVVSVLSMPIYAQPMGEEAPQVAQAPAEDRGSLNFLDELDVQAETVSNARASADAYLIEKDWSEGLNAKDDRFVVVGSANISKSPSDANFQLARETAYTRAMLTAKQSIATYYGQELATAVKRVGVEGQSADAQRREQAEAEYLATLDPGFFEKVKTLTNKKIDALLAKEGVSYDSPKAKSIIENMLNSSSFSDSMETMATQQVGALVTSKIFEQDGEIVVVAYYSPAAKELAAAINGKPVNLKVKPRSGDPVGIWVKKLKKSQLYSAMGVQFTSDEEGNIVMISYGQSKARSKSGESKGNAYEKAILNADANIRRFAGETLVYTAAKDKVENSVEFEDESLSEIEETFEQEISAVAAKLKISGISTVHRWDLVDPRSDSLICGAVRTWSIKTADMANISREDMKDASINRGGRTKAPAPARSASSATSPSQSAPVNTYQNVDTTKYKTESIESEDF
ncbi:MAG: hypothetical protein R3Y46_03410 [Opitutales bacterium]